MCQKIMDSFEYKKWKKSFSAETEVDLQEVPERLSSPPASPCRGKPKRQGKDKTKAKDFELERILRESLYDCGYSYEINSNHQSCHFEQENDNGCDDDLFPELVDLEEYPWELDFCDWKNGKICRKRGNLPQRTVLHCTKHSRKNQATMDYKVNSKSEYKENLICWNKKLKASKVPLLKRELRKAEKKVAELELKKNNVEKRLIVKKTPRRGSAQLNATTPTRRDVYNHNQFVLRNGYADKLRSEDFLLNLISLQDREITPEDFDLLLQLDSFVEVKTVPKVVIDQLRTEKVESEMGTPCMICMEEYEMGEILKYLNCGHLFHSSCIRTWLTVNSDKCPLDGQEVS